MSNLTEAMDAGALTVAATAEMERLAKQDKPFFMSISWATNHQPNLPSADFVGKSAIKNKYGDKAVELDFHIGTIWTRSKSWASRTTH